MPLGQILGRVSRVLKVQASSQNPAGKSLPPEPVYCDGWSEWHIPVVFH